VPSPRQECGRPGDRQLTQPLGQFLLLLVLALAWTLLAVAYLLDYRRIRTRHLQHIRDFYDRPRWRWRRLQTQDPETSRVAAQTVSLLAIAMGLFVLVEEIAALAGGRVH
jgi:hypothetical protein